MLVKLKSSEADSFFRDIVYRFKVPNSIIMDNGTQFTSKPFLQFCDDFNIYINWTGMAHPRTNGQVERAYGLILPGPKSRIFDRLTKFAVRWVAELLAIIWSLHTTPLERHTAHLSS